jgi:AAA15 family ATPase/GTPase
MDNHLLEIIEIKDFKCFKDFKAEGFKRVNIIGGKNNVGKTALMEACFINIYSDDVSLQTNALSSPKHSREFLEIGFRNITNEEKKDFLESIENYDSSSNINTVYFEIKEDSGIKEYIFINKYSSTTVNINAFSYEKTKKQNIKFISQLGFTKFQLKQVFIEVQKKDKEEILNEYINQFDDNVSNFKILGGDNPSCKVIDRDEYQSINEFGDGLKHYISIICSLFACENGYLFIDEIDNGIHYTQLDRLWEIILTISKEQNVQVFATTHSKECIESYARVSKKLEDEDISFISLYKDKKNILKSITFNSEEIQTRKELDLDNR